MNPMKTYATIKNRKVSNLLIINIKGKPGMVKW